MSYRLPSNAVQFGGWKCPEPTAKPDEPPAAAEGPTSDDEDVVAASTKRERDHAVVVGGALKKRKKEKKEKKHKKGKKHNKKKHKKVRARAAVVLARWLADPLAVGNMAETQAQFLQLLGLGGGNQAARYSSRPCRWVCRLSTLSR
jgi:hypothetical protein